jgi:hypothetical protein
VCWKHSYLWFQPYFSNFDSSRLSTELDRSSRRSALVEESPLSLRFVAFECSLYSLKNKDMKPEALSQRLARAIYYRKHRLQRVGHRTCGWNPNGHSGSDTLGILFISLDLLCHYLSYQQRASSNYLPLPTNRQWENPGKSHEEKERNVNYILRKHKMWCLNSIKSLQNKGVEK